MSLQLRPHQLDVVEKIREGFENGHRCQLLYAPTGFGKTETAIAIMKEIAESYGKTAMVMDRVVLVDQTSLRLGKYGIDHGVMQANHWRYRPRERIQVCSAQTLEKRKIVPDIDLMIIDECFSGDTLISTPSGLKKISNVRCGDIVYNSVGMGTVNAVSIKPTDELYKLEFDDGTIIECTGNHPFFTTKGWVDASKMEIGSISFSEKGMSLLWNSFYSEGKDGFRKTSECNFLEELAGTEDLLKILLEEVEEPNAQSRNQVKDKQEIKGDWSQTYKTWRERAIASFATVGDSSCSWGRVGGGAFCSYKNGSSEWEISESLQNRYSEQRKDDWNRVGWRKSLPNNEEGTGQKENRSSCFPRLVNISHIKRESPEPVYNLQVSGHPSYFANGKLVHNCHITRRGTTELIKNNPNLKVIGLTATPFTKGLGSIYTHIVGASSTGELIENGWLTPLRVFIAKEIDMTGAKKVAGEWSADEVSDRGMKIVGDVVEEWSKKTHEIFGRPRKTIVFSAGVDHGRELANKFNEAGYNFKSISYKEDDQYKRDIIEDFAKPDTDIHGLIATDILTRGFDVSDVMIGVSARPFSKSFSSHVQQLGRVMRPHPDKEFGVWLDHSGNYLRFRDDWDELYSDGVKKLKDGGEKAKKEPTEREKKESKCPSCGALWTSADDKCTECGHIRVRLSQLISIPGEMQELQEANRKLQISNQKFYSQVLYYARLRGMKDGWAAYKYKEKFGVFPRGLSLETEPPSPETMNWIKSRAIAFAKSKAKR